MPRKQLPEILEDAGFTAECLEDIQSILHGSDITVMGACCMGVAHFMHWNFFKEVASRDLLRLGARCKSIEEAVERTSAWIEEEKDSAS